MKIRIFTDGACSGNPGPGGWSSVFCCRSECQNIKGYETDTTNNRMELRAVVESCRKIFDDVQNGSTVMEYEIHSDSAYVINAINKCWLEKWRLQGWLTTGGDPVKNRDLWQQFVECRKVLFMWQIKVSFVKVRGHAGNAFNELADKLAKEQCMCAKQERR